MGQARALRRGGGRGVGLTRAYPAKGIGDTEPLSGPDRDEPRVEKADIDRLLQRRVGRDTVGAVALLAGLQGAELQPDIDIVVVAAIGAARSRFFRREWPGERPPSGGIAEA